MKFRFISQKQIMLIVQGTAQVTTPENIGRVILSKSLQTCMKILSLDNYGKIRRSNYQFYKGFINVATNKQNIIYWQRQKRVFVRASLRGISPDTGLLIAERLKI